MVWIEKTWNHCKIRIEGKTKHAVDAIYDTLSEKFGMPEENVLAYLRRFV